MESKNDLVTRRRIDLPGPTSGIIICFYDDGGKKTARSLVTKQSLHTVLVFYVELSVEL